MDGYLGETVPESERSDQLIDLRSPVVMGLLKKLLEDKTTKKNIIWATDAYKDRGKGCSDTDHIMPEAFFTGNPVGLMPRTEKASDLQAERTRKKAEVFTPVWLCNRMNNFCDEQWFGRKDVFNRENGDGTWAATEGKICFPDGKTWQEYVDSRRLEITCGEAPFLVSRYDAATGRFILPPLKRVGILDRKLRIVNENAESEDEWRKWSERAFQSCYGYEWQGDSLLIARINLLMTYCDYYAERWGREPCPEIAGRIANIISWNIWQMDGLKDAVPFGKPYREHCQKTLFDSFDDHNEPQEDVALPCKIYDWRRDNSVAFSKRKARDKMSKKMFDFVIGNPPYQEVNDNNSRQPPVYHIFMDAAYEVGDAVELITPSRFLFNAGLTPENWNLKMLNDPHLKVISYIQKSDEIFPGTDIKGVAITYRDESHNYGPIRVFTTHPELNTILHKVISSESNLGYFDEITSSQGAYKFTPKLFEDHPEVKNYIGAGTKDKIVSKAVKQLDWIFLEQPKNAADYVRVLSMGKKGRIIRFIAKEYLQGTDSLYKYKVIVAESNGKGPFESLSAPMVGDKGLATADTFLSIGSFDSSVSAERALKYVKTKFARALLGVLKANQHNPKSTWKYVPIQNFENDSDIDWNKDISEIDVQLYSKYKLSAEEIKFIETHVQGMD